MLRVLTTPTRRRRTAVRLAYWSHREVPKWALIPPDDAAAEQGVGVHGPESSGTGRARGTALEGRTD